MREIDAASITDAVAKMAVESCRALPEDVMESLEKAREREESALGLETLDQIIENARVARAENLPLCQDTGMAVIFVEMGQDVRVKGNLMEALQEGVRRGYDEGLLRKSVANCVSRVNTGDNTPAVVHVELLPGDSFRILFAAKGGGAENMSALAMLKPSDGISGIKEFVRDRIIESGGNPCPPLVIGVGLGGTFERCAYLAKKALFRPVGEPNPNPEIARLEKELLQAVNETGVGPMGYGGRVTALAAHVLAQPCHIASLPVAVNINCHSHRHREINL